MLEPAFMLILLDYSHLLHNVGILRNFLEVTIFNKCLVLIRKPSIVEMLFFMGLISREFLIDCGKVLSFLNDIT